MPSMFKHHFDAEPFAEKYPRLVAEVDESLAEGERLAGVIRSQLAGVAENV